MRALLVLILLEAPFAVCLAQTPQPIETDRPDFTESATTVESRRLQVEGGYTFTREGDTDEHALGEVLLRYGIASRMELRIGLNSHAWVDGPEGDEAGLEDPSVGVKIALSKESHRFRPTSALLASVTGPGPGDFGEDAWQPETKLALAWDAGAAGVGANLGYAYSREERERFHQGIASLALGFDVTERTGGYVEVFGLFPAAPDADAAAVANAGLTYLVHSDLQLDARIGLGLSDAAPDVFVGAGVARRW